MNDLLKAPWIHKILCLRKHNPPNQVQKNEIQTKSKTIPKKEQGREQV